jgi:hypothetical protein
MRNELIRAKAIRLAKEQKCEASYIQYLTTCKFNVLMRRLQWLEYRA